jgi:hypothetical protein
MIWTRGDYSEAVRLEPQPLKLPAPCSICNGGKWSRDGITGELRMSPHVLESHGLAVKGD